MKISATSFCKRWCTLALLCAAAQVVAAQPFSFVALGDFKSGSTLCSDEESQVQLGHFGLFDSALMRHDFQSSTDCFQAVDLMFFNRSSNKACFYQFIDEIL